MSAATILHALMTAIDERRWDDLEQYLAADFACRFVHTGEQFDRAGWIRLNAEYPGFDRLLVRDLVGDDDRAACWSTVTGVDADGVLQEFGCASFAVVGDGRIRSLTEIWTDVAQTPPPGTRP